jgi:hypothetical protein
MKRKMFFGFAVAILSMSLVAEEKNAGGSAGKILYENNFEKAELEKVPAEFLVLDGGFTVKQEGTNKFLELPGAPLETFGVLFGPTVESDVEVSARIRGAAKGRRFPTFAVGLNGVGGYKLQVSPAKKAVELFRGDELVATAPFEEKVGPWMNLHLQLCKISEAQWKIEGSVWPENSVEPKNPFIVFNDKIKPLAGRASIWGSPFAGTPIQFDDLKVVALTGKK